MTSYASLNLQIYRNNFYMVINLAPASYHDFFSNYMFALKEDSFFQSVFPFKKGFHIYYMI